MAYPFLVFWIFSLLIRVNSVLCSSSDSSGYVVLENFQRNTSKEYVVYKGTVLPKPYKLIADAIENLKIRDDDVWVCTFPRSGTTWVQEMVWMIAHDLDFNGARAPIYERFPYLEISSMELAPLESLKNPLTFIKTVKKMHSPRFMKTHLPFHLLPRQLREREKRAKIIHVSRNVKDVSVSQYYHYKKMWGYNGTLEQLSRDFMEDRVVTSPYWNHVNGYLGQRGDKNTLFLKFEDMKSDLRSQIKKAASFLGKKLNEQMIRVLEGHLSFKKMQNNSALNMHGVVHYGDNEKFIRKGEVGQWKTAMSKELIQQFDDWIHANSIEKG